QEVFQEVGSAYSMLRATKQVRLFRGFLPHQYDFFNRRETYAWFNQWLAKRDLGVSEAEMDEIPPEELRCTRTGQVLTSLGGLSVFKLSAQKMRALAPANASGTSSQEADKAPTGISSRLRALLSLPPARNTLATRTLSSDSRSNLTIEEFEFRSEPRIRVPGWFVKPGAAATRLPTVLYLTQGGKDAAADSASPIRGIVKKGFALCAVDLRGSGITSPRFPAYGALRYQDGRDHLREDFAWASLILGKPPLGQRVWDLMRCLDYLESRRDVDRERIYVFGVRGGALTALTAYVLDHRPRSILCDGMISNLASVVESENYSWGLEWFISGMLREFDLPDLMAACAPRQLWLLNTTGPTDNVLAAPDATLRVKPAIESYSRLNASDQLRTLVSPKEKKMEVVAAWIESA
ncbi:MAG: alpha/beta hydrolase family protein, partial [Terriglobia bacterium]